MTSRRSVVRALVPLAATLLAGSLSACGALDAGAGDGDSRELTVLAAASLSDVFADLAAEFERKNEGTTVAFSSGSSTDLAEQVADGAPGDVLATADESSMQLATDAGVAGEITAFATNVLTLVTPPDNPGAVESLDDLDGTTWVRCTDEAPCGRVAAAVLADNGITAEPSSLEEDVRATLDKVISAEADAGLVYATDAVAAGDQVRALPIPGAEAELTSYFMTVLEQSPHRDLAQEWVDHVTSEEGLAILEQAGFGAP
jgi:molybdate transport system substrate-binding protein